MYYKTTPLQNTKGNFENKILIYYLPRFNECDCYFPRFSFGKFLLSFVQSQDIFSMGEIVMVLEKQIENLVDETLALNRMVRTLWTEGQEALRTDPEDKGWAIR